LPGTARLRSELYSQSTYTLGLAGALA
jgi:hypothetical protein